jgi:hypothetical protein
MISKRRFRVVLALLAGVTALPAAASAQVMNFKILTNSSQASFRSDAPPETVVGTAALEGIQGKNYLDTEVDANRWVTFEVKTVEITEPLTPGRETPAKIHGVLTVKNKPVDTVADGSVTYIKLTPEQVEQQKRFGFLFLKLANDIQMATDLVFVRTP